MSLRVKVQMLVSQAEEDNKENNKIREAIKNYIRGMILQAQKKKVKKYDDDFDDDSGTSRKSRKKYKSSGKKSRKYSRRKQRYDDDNDDYSKRRKRADSDSDSNDGEVTRFTKEMDYLEKAINDAKYPYPGYIQQAKAPLVSIIIPITVENNKKYFNRVLVSIRSIQNQSLKSMEIILVDTKSSAESIATIREEMEKDKRISYVRIKDEPGSMEIYSKGAEVATGKYLLLLHPDSALCAKDAINFIVKRTKSRAADYVHFNVLSGNSDTTMNTNEQFRSNLEKKLDIEQPKLKNYLPNSMTKTIVAWDKLYNREIFMKAVEDFRKLPENIQKKADDSILTLLYSDKVIKY